MLKKVKMTIEHDIFIDPRDGQEYKTVKLKDGNVWMAENFNFDIGDGCCLYDNDPKNGDKYGRLYTWDAAMKACPDGWRLPSDEEWREMTGQYGKEYNASEGQEKNDSNNAGKSAYKALIKSGNSGFSALLGVRRYFFSCPIDGAFGSIKWYIGFWSSTEKDSTHAWECSFFDKKTSRNISEKTSGFNVRYIKNNQNGK